MKLREIKCYLKQVVELGFELVCLQSKSLFLPNPSISGKDTMEQREDMLPPGP